jgi:hypothetical protein
MKATFQFYQNSSIWGILYISQYSHLSTIAGIPCEKTVENHQLQKLLATKDTKNECGSLLALSI